MDHLPSPRRSLPALAIVLALLAGCSQQELYSKLDERQANEMVAVLRSVGIEAEKELHEGLFSVNTASADFPRAVQVLSAQGLPREQFDTIGKVFKREGFVSSPLEERARLVFALSQEMSSTISSIDGVVSARVHLVVPERNPLSDKPQPAAASVFIKYRPDKDLTRQVPQIKALVVNSIEGLPYDNVTVALFPAETLPLGAEAASPKAKPSTPAQPTPVKAGLDLPLIGGAVGGVFLLGGVLLWWRRRGGGERPGAGERPGRDDEATLPAPALRPVGGSSVRSREELQAALRRAAAGQPK